MSETENPKPPSIGEMTNEELIKLMDDAPVQFGLVQQGHIPTIESMLANGKPWEMIGEAIHWEPKTACIHYQIYQIAVLELALETVEAKCAAMGEVVELLKSATFLSSHCEDEIADARIRADETLKSLPVRAQAYLRLERAAEKWIESSARDGTLADAERELADAVRGMKG